MDERHGEGVEIEFGDGRVVDGGGDDDAVVVDAFVVIVAGLLFLYLLL